MNYQDPTRLLRRPTCTKRGDEYTTTPRVLNSIHDMQRCTQAPLLVVGRVPESLCTLGTCVCMFQKCNATKACNWLCFWRSKRARTRAHTHTLTYTHTHSHSHTYTYVRTYIRTYYVCIRTYIHTCILTLNFVPLK